MNTGAFKGEFKPPLFVDAIILAVTLALLSLSLVMVYSTTGISALEKFNDPLFYVKRQGIAVALGLILMFTLSRIPITWVQRVSPFLLPLAVLLLVLPLLPGLGERAGGAQRWVKIGFLRFQPGEVVKLCFIVFMAGYFARHEQRLREFVAGIVKPLGLISVVGVLLLIQPDFGSTAVISVVTLVMMAVSGVRLLYFGVGAGILGSVLSVLVLVSPYRMARIFSFLSPWKDASGKGYQLIQSLIAVGTGQATGVGLGESQQKLFFLPAAHTDFIFAVIAEELGFFGGAVVIMLFLLFLWRGIKLARRVADVPFACALSTGLTMLIVIPAMLNVGVVTGVLPTKGMVLPMVGYGGSSVVACLAVVGLLLACARDANRRAASGMR